MPKAEDPKRKLENQRKTQSALVLQIVEYVQTGRQTKRAGEAGLEAR